METIDKAFQAFFNDWVEKQTEEQSKEAPTVGRKTLRRQIRDDAMMTIVVTLERAQNDSLEMVRFENP